MDEGRGLLGTVREVQEIRVQGSRVLAEARPGLTSNWGRLLVLSPVTGTLRKLSLLKLSISSASVKLLKSAGRGWW